VGKIFASYVSEKGLITRIHRGFNILNSPQINEPIKKWAELSQKNKFKWPKNS
jgi:hypothetical protein